MKALASEKLTGKDIVDQSGKYIAGGVVSLNRKVAPNLVFQKAFGSKLYDVDGKEYIDYHAAFSPYLLGHNYKPVNDAAKQAMDEQWSLMGVGTTQWESELAKLLCEAIPSLDLVQITNTGSEATAHAIRLSRAYTGRDGIILMLGGYNGWHNEVARAVMPTLKDIGERVSPGEYKFLSMSAGIPESTKRHVHIVNFNDLESVRYVMKRYPVACVMTEPVLQNIGVVSPKPGFLKGLIDLCEENGSVCIFDEVKTGFRSGLGGYQKENGLTPHLSVFGKAVANGFPLGVIGGKREIMELFDSPIPKQRVLIAGTYNAHPINTAAAIATIKTLQQQSVYEAIDKSADLLYKGLYELFKKKGIETVISSNRSAFCVYFCKEQPFDFHDVIANHDFEFDLKFRKQLIKNGIYHIPVACKQGSVSYAHTEDDIYRTLEATQEVLKSI